MRSLGWTCLGRFHNARKGSPFHLWLYRSLHLQKANMWQHAITAYHVFDCFLLWTWWMGTLQFFQSAVACHGLSWLVMACHGLSSCSRHMSPWAGPIRTPSSLPRWAPNRLALAVKIGPWSWLGGVRKTYVVNRSKTVISRWSIFVMVISHVTFMM